MKEDLYRSQFRLPYTLYDAVKSAADKNKRSVNAELVLRLEASFVEDDLDQRIAKVLKNVLREEFAELIKK